MNIFKEHIKYLKDNPKHLWFKRKLYGWGWTPATWQGWLVIVIWLALVLALALTINDNSSNSKAMLTFVLPVTLLTVALIRICYKKGEKPRWQWGVSKD